MLDIIINIITHTHTRTQTTGSHAHTNGRLTPSLCFRASCVCFSQQQGVFAGCIGCAVWTVAEAASSHPRTRKHLHVLGGGAVHPSQRGRTVFPHRRPRVRALGACVCVHVYMCTCVCVCVCVHSACGNMHVNAQRSLSACAGVCQMGHTFRTVSCRPQVALWKLSLVPLA